MVINDIFTSNPLITLQELESDLSNKLNICFDEPLYIDYIYSICGSIVYSTKNLETKKDHYICANCRNDIKLSECEVSYYCGEKIPTPYNFLEIYSEVGLINKEYYGICPRCRKGKIIPYTKYPLNYSMEINKLLDYFYCSNCSELFEISSFYKIADKQILNLWNSGLWLEWYIKKLCEKSFPKSIVRQGNILKHNDDVIEIDIIIYKNNMTYVIECKSISPIKKADWGEISNVVKYNMHIDNSILACTGKLKSIDKKTLNKRGIKVIENKDIEKISTFLKNI